MWKANNIHEKYCTQTIPVSLNSSFEKKNIMEDSIPYTWDFYALIKDSKTNNAGRTSHSKHLLLQIMYTNMSIITLFLQEMFPRCPEKATFSRWHHGATIHSLLCMSNGRHIRVPTNIFHIIWISSCKFKSRLNTWISWKVVARCTGSLQTKQQGITCL